MCDHQLMLSVLLLALLSGTCKSLSYDGNWCLDEEDGCKTKTMLDTMSKFGTNRDWAVFPPFLWRRMKTCMTNFSPSPTSPNLLLQASDAAWEKMLTFSATNGAANDRWDDGCGTWLECDPRPLSETDNTTVPGAFGVVIGQPCNFVSNLPYYRTMLAICEYQGSWMFDDATLSAMVQSFSALAFGSSFFHASATGAGSLVDNFPNQAVSFLAHQAAIESLPYSPITHDVAEEPRTLSGIQLANEMTRILLEEDVYDWSNAVRRIPIPELDISYAAISITALHIALPSQAASAVANLLATALVAEVNQGFVLETLEPAMIQSLADNGIRLDPVSWLQFATSVLGVVIKLLYAFLWQEEFFIQDLLPDPELNRLGAVAMPIVNRICNTLTNYPRTDIAVQLSVRVYPGDRDCRARLPHSKWHEQSANGVVDLFLVANDIKRLLSGQRLPAADSILPLKCADDNGCFDGFDTEVLGTVLGNAMDTCVHHVTESWKESDMNGLGVCILRSVLVVMQPSSSSTQAADSSLDSCLLENDCISIVNGGLDVDRLSICVGLRPIQSILRSGPCRSHVNRIRAATCVLLCGGGTSCLLSCLQKNGDLSPVMDLALECIVRGPQGRCVDRDQWEMVGTSLASSDGSTTAAKSLVNGLAQLMPCWSSCPIRGGVNEGVGLLGKAFGIATCWFGCISQAGVGGSSRAACALGCLRLD